MKRLVLFDIDGTLIHGGPLWRECFEQAFLHCFPDLLLNTEVTFNGKTDPQICREMLGQNPKDLDHCVEKVIADYLRRAETELPARTHEVQALPGTHTLLQRLSEIPALTLGLLTGNVRRGAFIKLSAVGMQKYFPFGVYGDDHWDRYELPALAAKRAHDEFGLAFQGKEIVVIGDTVHDVNCGKSIGVRTIAVGTGRNVDRDELLAARPDYFFEDLSDIESVVHAISAD